MATGDKIYLAQKADLDAHKANQNNPHGVTLTQIGAKSDTWFPNFTEVLQNPFAVVDGLLCAVYEE